jgi:hypothetical protein
MFDVEIDEKSYYCGQCVMFSHNILTTVCIGWTIYYIYYITPNHHAVLVKLRYGGTRISPDILSHHTFDELSETCTCNVFSKMMTEEEYEIDMVRKMSSGPNWLEESLDLPQEIYIEGCKTITRDNLQMLNKLNVIERFTGNQIHCNVHDQYRFYV